MAEGGEIQQGRKSVGEGWESVEWLQVWSWWGGCRFGVGGVGEG